MNDLLEHSRRIEAKCPNRANHTKTPEGYVDHAEWMERMAATHDQKQCQACGLWAIWIAKNNPKAATPKHCPECNGEGSVPSGVEEFGVREMIGCPVCQGESVPKVTP